MRRPSKSVTLHTTLGDLKIEVFCDEVPRTSENFLALAASGRYDDTKFHRCAVHSHWALPRSCATHARRDYHRQKHQGVHDSGVLACLHVSSLVCADLHFTRQGGDPTGTGKVRRSRVPGTRPARADVRGGLHNRAAQACGATSLPTSSGTT